MEYQQQVRSYFARKADQYDATDDQPYWRLSDELLWWLLENTLVPGLPCGARVLDAGGGTGRWSKRLLQRRPDIEIVLVDLSAEMMGVAAAKMRAAGLERRIELIQSDLCALRQVLPPASVDGVICFHNVLGFIPSAATVFQELAQTLRPGGQLALVVPNRFHAAFFNTGLGRLPEASAAIVQGRGRFTADMPEMTLFTPHELQQWCSSADLQSQLLTGFPVLLYPGHQETQLHGSTQTLQELLSEECSARIIEIEKQAILSPGVAARGNNLYLSARKL
jgi:SAM-dependent methyltransferase